MENNMVIKNKFNVVEYVSLVNDIAEEFFDDEGDYIPHIGRLNIMRLFYNKCVVESKFDLSHNFQDALQLDYLVGDEDFIKAFNEAVAGDGMFRLDFANAYADAMSIVNERKSSVNNIIRKVEKGIAKITDKISPILSEDNITSLSQIAQDISNGKLSAESIVEAYANSQRFKELVDNNKSANIVPIKNK